MKVMTRLLFFFIIISIFMASAQCTVSEKGVGADLEKGFVTPPDSAKPCVWWHWMNGNVTKEGIKADLEWMHRIGIGGFQNFDAAWSTPQVVPKRLEYMTPEWKDAFRYATNLADSLGLEMAIAGSPGWSESGGPWVTPEQAMKKLVWSETRVEGGKPFSGIVPSPPTTTGRFQNFEMEKSALSLPGEKPETREYYKDAAVVAFRVPENDFSMAELQPKVTAGGGEFNLTELTDGDLAKATLLPAAPVGEKAWVQFEFPEPRTIQGITIVGGGEQSFFKPNSDKRTLETGDDGKSFLTVIEIPPGGAGQQTFAFAPVTAKYFRFCFETMPSSPGPDLAQMGLIMNSPSGPAGTQIAELVLHTGPRVNRFEEKAAFATAADLAFAATPDVSNAVAKADVLDLTSKMSSDGKLDWTPPDGKWTVLRLGYSLTGHQNSPASQEATGLEVDKLNAEHVRAYFNNYLDQYKDATSGLMGEKGLQFIITDSWEAGVQNWTNNMVAEFADRRGYSILPWLPVLTGHVVGSSEESDRFLWDFRKTLSELVAENHYDQLTDILNARGMKRYSESHESGRAFIGDGMEVKRSAAIPMSAMWTPGGLNSGTGVATRYEADIRESASVAHLYGQNLVAAESLTAGGNAFGWSPEMLKPTADLELASGLNRFVIHTSVHQPVDDKIPGLGLGPFGQWFTRHETWAEQAGAWTTYLARSSYMLQQGRFVADIIYYYGEDNNITALFGNKLPDIPDGYNYDFVNADALIHVLEVNEGNITTPGGMSYRVLALDENSRYMSLPVLRKLRELVTAGAVVVGPKPIQTPSLSDDPEAFKTVVDELWKNETGENTIGKGTIFAGKSLKEVLAALGIKPDFQFYKPRKSTELLYVHRKVGDIDIYWVNNRSDRMERPDAAFRVEGKAAEIWHPETGKIEEAAYAISDGVTRVPLLLQPNDAVFVVFRHKADENSKTIEAPVEQHLSTIEGPWHVTFQPERGAPARTTFNSLTPWNEHTDNGIKYFSGTGTYSRTIQAPAEWFKKGTQLWLDLGRVKNLAEVVVNNTSLGVVWKTPFQVNVTDALKQGENMLEIKITNLWVNRLIGDQQKDVKTKITFTALPFYQADSPLLPSGLLGPVQISMVSSR